MRTLALGAIIALVLVPGLPERAGAKPAYCFKALVQCQTSCGSYYMENFCKAGCGIGYLMCGS